MQLKDLNEKIKKVSESLSHTAWIAHQQRENLDRLTFSGRGPDSSPSLACLRANLLEQTYFKDAYKELNYQENLYSEFVRSIRSRPQFLSYCLTAGDKLNLPQMVDIVSILFGGIYGSCLMPEDEQLVLRLLNHLMRSQLTSSSNPRKLLRQKSCAFTRLYKIFSEELFSAKLFLTSALYEPILSLLSDDEIFLDIDPSKASIRFAPSERLRKFGKEGTPEFAEKLKVHRTFIVNKLVHLTNNFIRGIRENLHCFPPSLARLLRAMYSLMMSSGKAEPKEVHAVCVDAIFTLFICPAMVDPNPVGIIDTPISYIARSNLMQVAQILQVLAMGRFEDAGIETNPACDLYSSFDKEVVSSLLEAMLESAKDLAAADVNKNHHSTSRINNLNSCGGISDLLIANDPIFVEGMEHNANISGQNLHPENPSNGPTNSLLPVENVLETAQSGVNSHLYRISILLTRDQLDSLISFFRSLYKSLSTDHGSSQIGENIDIIDLEKLISPLPDTIPGGTNASSKANSPVKSIKSTNSKPEDSFVSMAQAKKQQLTNKLSTVIKHAGNVSSAATGSGSSNISPSVSSSSLSTDGGNIKGANADRKQSAQDIRIVENGNGMGSTPDETAGGYTGTSKKPKDPETVLIIPLNDSQDCNSKPPGFLSEEYVLEKARAQQVLSNRTIIRPTGHTHITGGGGRVVRMNLPGHDMSLHDSSSSVEPSGNVHPSGSRICNAGDGTPSSVGEKRTRFSLTHDDGSIGNTSDNLEAISEAASNHSVASSLEDEVDEDNVDPDDPLQIIDNLSDMVSANVSGRGTPNVSGRDTPSSQVTEGDEVVVGVVGGAGSEAGGEGASANGAGSGIGIGSGSETEGVSVVMDERQNRDAQPENRDMSANEDRQGDRSARTMNDGSVPPLRGSNMSRGITRGKGRPGPPKGKNGEPDLEEKFGRFEIKPPGSRTTTLGSTSVGSIGGCVGSEHGDETVSMISDTWSTDVLASDTESYYNVASAGHGSIGAVEELLLHRRPPIGEVAELGASGSSATRAVSTSGAPSTGLRQNAPSVGPVPHLSALLDIAETASEAWSMDVLASDTESLRLGELDTEEDTMSVARSDDTRFTDDTTRSDPEQILEFSSTTTGNLLGNQNSRRRDDVTLLNKSLRSTYNQIGATGPPPAIGENNLLRPSRAAAVEQWARQSSVGNRLGGTMSTRRGSDNSAGSGRLQDSVNVASGSILKKQHGSMLASGGSSAESSREHPSSADADDVVADLIDIVEPSLQQLDISEQQPARECLINSELTPGVVRVTNIPNQTSPRQIANSKNGTNTYQAALGASSGSNISDSSTAIMNPVVSTESAILSTENSGMNPRRPPVTFSENNENRHRGSLEVEISSLRSSSTSTVNSMTNAVSGTDHVKPDTTSESKNTTASASTGAIPKSISFDTAQNHPSSGASKAGRDKSFFPKGWKLPKIGRSRGGHGGSAKFKLEDQRGNARIGNERILSENSSYNSTDGTSDNILQRLPSDEASSASDGIGQVNVETSDDILEKYRAKGRTQQNSSSLGLSSSNDVILGTEMEATGGRSVEESCDSVFQDRFHGGINESLSVEDDDDFESASTSARRSRSIEDTYAFQDAKRKLRLMLAEVII